MEETTHEPERDPRALKGRRSLDTPAEKFFWKWGPPAVLIGVISWAVFSFIFLIYHSRDNGFIVRIVEEHFPAMILVQLAAITALCLVLLLRWTSGSLEFEFWGQAKLKGASGPLLLWVICFLTIIFAIKMLWPLTSEPITQKKLPNQEHQTAR